MTTGAARGAPVCVRDIMSAPVIQVDMDDTLEAILNLFKQRNIHHTIVCKRDTVRGVISDRDVLRSLSPFVGTELMERSQDQNTLRKRAHRLMTRQPITIGPGESIVEASRRMVTKRVSCLPVIDKDETLLGILTSTDILRWVASAK